MHLLIHIIPGPSQQPRLLSSSWGPGFFINKLKAGVVGACLNHILIYISRNSSTHPTMHSLICTRYVISLHSCNQPARVRHLASQIVSTWQGCFRLNSRVHPPSRATSCKSNSVDLVRVLPLFLTEISLLQHNVSTLHSSGAMSTMYVSQLTSYMLMNHPFILRQLKIIISAPFAHLDKA